MASRRAAAKGAQPGTGSLGPRSRLASLATAAMAFLLSVATIEVGFRLAGFDFEFKRRAFEKRPIAFRQPLVPLEDGLFRRMGPARWEGQVLTPVMRTVGVPERLIPPETEVSISYDRNGFRNPQDLGDWEVVVVGDSFTELGHLPDEALFTTRLGQLLSARVKNLGVGYTGPLTYVAYLKHYGKAPSTRHAVMAFFEGNDLEDLARESRAVRQARRRREQGLAQPDREARLDSLEPQSSFLKAAFRLVTAAAHSDLKPLPNAVFEHGEARVPVTVWYAPVPAARLPREVPSMFGEALTEWSRTAGTLGVEPWLLYLPTKLHALHGRLRFTSDAEPRLVAWAPNDLALWVQQMAEKRGIAFVDATPALRAAAAAGRIPYNTVWDNHLNREGAEIVARVLAAALGPRDSRSPGPPTGGRDGSG